MEEKIIKYIEILLKKCQKENREDIRQELLMFSYELIKKTSYMNSDNKEAYIFVSLKNEMQRLNKKYKKSNFISLDSINPKSGQTYLESIITPSHHNNRDKQLQMILRIKTILSKEEYDLLFDYCVKGMTQKLLSQKYDVTQQSISKKINSIKVKVKKNI